MSQLSHRTGSTSRRDASTRFDNDLRYRVGGHELQTHLTPAYVLEPVRAALGGSIDLDPCTTSTNPTGAAAFFTVADDGLDQPWEARTIYVNPPYGRAREPWVVRCIAAASAGARVVLLIPAHTDTRAFQRAAASSTALVLVKGRVKFGVPRPACDDGYARQVAATHPSALIGWNVALAACSHLGLVVKTIAAEMPDAA